MTTTNNPTTWRDLADQLTDEQVKKLGAAAWMDPADLADVAHQYVKSNQLQTAMAHVPTPAQAHSTSRWFDDGQTVARTIYGREWQLATVTVRIIGEQDAAAVTKMGVEVRDHTDHDMTASGARELAAALIEAADELDRLNGDAPPF